MDRKKALAIASAVTATVTAGVAAIAANFGLLTTANDPVGKLDARSVVESTPATGQPKPRTEVTIVYEDVPIGSASSPGDSTAPSSGATASTADDSSDDDSVDSHEESDDESDDDITSEDEHEEEHEEEFEGIEDDD